MSDDPEPTVNISGGVGGGGVTAEFDPSTAETRTEEIVDRLGELYWEKTYGGQDALTCLVRTILSQNTSDKASQPAHDSLIDRYDSENVDLAQSLADADREVLAETISSAGLYNQKSKRLIETAEWILADFGSASEFDSFVKEGDPEEVRETLLSIRGVGPKTADCVLLFAGGQPGVFPVDTHVHRIARRLGVAPADADHEGVREVLEAETPAEKCGFAHTATLQFGREYCRARKPACLEDPEACPMADLCEQVGVYPATDEVVDPADAPEAE